VGHRAPASAERLWLDYLRDVGFADLYLDRSTGVSPTAAAPIDAAERVATAGEETRIAGS
jgi:hypothetical protein